MLVGDVNNKSISEDVLPREKMKMNLGNRFPTQYVSMDITGTYISEAC